MLHILHSGETQTNDRVLRAMFAARKQVFVDLLKWDVPVVDGMYEIDRFDDAHSAYLVLTDREGGHLGSARLLRTDRPHILSSLYPELCADGVPQGPRIREVTRFCLDRRLKAAQRREVRNTLVAALADHALERGIESYSAIAGIGWFEQIFTFGWRCRPLGRPAQHGGERLSALRIDIDANTPALLRAAGIVASPALTGETRAAA